MITKIVAIKDSAIQAYTQPMFVPHTGGAIRSFTDAIQNPPAQNDMFKHPTDLELYELGEFDDSTGRFATYDDPKLLLRGKDAMVSKAA